MVAAVHAVISGEENAAARLAKARDCRSCHELHRAPYLFPNEKPKADAAAQTPVVRYANFHEDQAGKPLKKVLDQHKIPWTAPAGSYRWMIISVPADKARAARDVLRKAIQEQRISAVLIEAIDAGSAPGGTPEAALKRTLVTGGINVYGLAFSADGTVAAGTRGGTIKVWDVEGTLLAVLPGN